MPMPPKNAIDPLIFFLWKKNLNVLSSPMTHASPHMNSICKESTIDGSSLLKRHRSFANGNYISYRQESLVEQQQHSEEHECYPESGQSDADFWKTTIFTRD